MDRRFAYPIIVLCIAVGLLIFDRFFPSGPSHEEGEKVEPKPATWGGDLSISARNDEEEPATSAQSPNLGSLELVLTFQNMDAPESIVGSVALTDLGAEDSGTLEYMVRTPRMLYENIDPGSYKVIVEIALPGTENDFLSPGEVKITAGSKTRYEVTVPPFQ